jgi:hypothetical protein
MARLHGAGNFRMRRVTKISLKERDRRFFYSRALFRTSGRHERFLCATSASLCVSAVNDLR